MRLGLLISAMMGLAVNWMVPATASTSTSPSAIIRGNVAPAYYYHGGLLSVSLPWRVLSASRLLSRPLALLLRAPNANRL